MIEQLHLSLDRLDTLINSGTSGVIELVKAYNEAVKACEEKVISFDELNERRIKLGILFEQKLETLSTEPAVLRMNLSAVDECITLLRALSICRYGLTLGMSEVYYTYVDDKAFNLFKEKLEEFIRTKHIQDLKTTLDVLGNYKILLQTES